MGLHRHAALKAKGATPSCCCALDGYVCMNVISNHHDMIVWDAYSMHPFAGLRASFLHFLPWHWSLLNKLMAVCMSRPHWNLSWVSLGFLECTPWPVCSFSSTCHMKDSEQPPCPTCSHMSPHSLATQVAGMQIAKGLKTYVDDQKPLVFEDPATDMQIAQTCPTMPH